MAEQRGVRVAHDGQDRDLGKRIVAGPTAEGADGADDVRERLLRHAEQVKQLRGPLAGLDVHQLRARGIADLDLVLVRQLVQDPRVDGA